MTSRSPQTATPARPARRLPLPRTWSIRPSDIVAVLAGNAVLIVGMWVRHGGLGQLDTVSGMATGMGQLTALLGTYLALVQLVLMSRSPWLDQVVGTDRLMVWHRWTGFACLWLLLGHAVLTTVGWSLGDGSSILDETVSLLLTYPYVLMASVALGLFIAVAVSSVRAARRRLSYETWFGIHLYAYLAIALAFLHEVVVGTDFIGDRIAVWYWVALYVVAIGLLVTFRVVQPVAFSWRHRLRVANVVQEAPGIASIYLAGRHLDRLAVRAGQFFQFRFLSGGGWWRHHPFSISAAPNGQFLRLTVKDLGDDSHWATNCVQACVSSPKVPTMGAFTGARIGRSKALLLAGGIGITPLRAMLEELPPGPNAVTLLYRASSWDGIIFRDELETLAKARGARVTYLVGRRGSPEMPFDPLEPGPLQQLVPDVRDRDVFFCGSDSFMDRIESSLRSLKVPQHRSMQNVSPSRPRATRAVGPAPGRVPRRGLAALIATGAGVVLLFNFKTPDTFTALAPGSTDGIDADPGLGLGATPSPAAPPATGPVPPASPATTAAPISSPTADGTATNPPAPAPTDTPVPADTPVPLVTPKATPAPAKQVLTGQEVDTQFGPTQVQVTVAGGKIVAVKALQLPYDRQRSAQISQIVEPYLHDEALQAQSANIDLISGATYTSMAYAQSLQSALDQAK